MSPYKTLKASTLNNRAVQSTPGEEIPAATTLKESPRSVAGALFQSAACDDHLSAGPTDAAVTDR